MASDLLITTPKISPAIINFSPLTVLISLWLMIAVKQVLALENQWQQDPGSDQTTYKETDNSNKRRQLQV